LKEALRAFHKMCLLKITTNTPIISSSTQRCFYEAMAWGGLRKNIPGPIYRRKKSSNEALANNGG
jgi:hypothetical protein